MLCIFHTPDAEGQGLTVQHLSVVKTYPVTQRVHFTFTAAVSNLFNHPTFYGVQSNFENPQFGKFTSTVGLQTTNESAAQRQITFAGPAR